MKKQAQVIKKLEKKMAKIERKYEQERGKLVKQERLLKMAESTQKKLDELL